MRAAKALLTGLGLLIPAVAAAETQAEIRARLGKAVEARILFVGNSYSFKVPAALAGIAKEKGKKAVVEQVTKGGWTLKKHAAAAATLERIRSGTWDVIVFQDQSQLPSFAKRQREKEMIPHAVALAKETRKAGAIPVFFQTWGRRDGDKKNAKMFPEDTFAKMQVRLVTGYAEAAKEAGDAFVVPVGLAWAKEMSAGRGARLYSKDGSHPSKEGVGFAAKVFWEALFGK